VRIHLARNVELIKGKKIVKNGPPRNGHRYRLDPGAGPEEGGGRDRLTMTHSKVPEDRPRLRRGMNDTTGIRCGYSRKERDMTRPVTSWAHVFPTLNASANRLPYRKVGAPGNE